VEEPRVQTFTVPWRKVCAALPAVALIGSGLTLTALAGPAGESDGAVARKVSPAIVVPDVAPDGPAAQPESTKPQTDAYRRGVAALPASHRPSANPAWSTSVAAKRMTKPLEPTKATPRAPAPGRPGSIPIDVPAPQPTVTLGAPAPPAPSAPSAPPASPSAPSTTSEPVPPSCLPVSPGPELSSVPAAADPAPLKPCLPLATPPAALHPAGPPP
jgi:hypothetical protein